MPEEVRPITADELRPRCDAGFLGGAILRTSATVHPARLALGLRARVISAGVRLHERTAVRRLSSDAIATTATGVVRAGAAVLAVNSATAGFPGFRLAHAVASSHMVLTEPVPDVIEELGWTGGEAIADRRTLLHYTRTTRDGRIAFGWGGGRMGFGARRLSRLEVDPRAAEVARNGLLRFFPQLRGRRITHAWGGPIDVSPTHLPIFGSRGRVHHGFGFTGNGVGPSYLGGEILARLALDRRDELTRLALVDPDRKLDAAGAASLGGRLGDSCGARSSGRGGRRGSAARPRDPFRHRASAASRPSAPALRRRSTSSSGTPSGTSSGAPSAALSASSA